MLQDKPSFCCTPISSVSVGETDVIMAVFSPIIVMLFDAVLFPGVKSCVLDNFNLRPERLITFGFVIILVEITS